MTHDRVVDPAPLDDHGLSPALDLEQLLPQLYVNLLLLAKLNILGVNPSQLQLAFPNSLTVRVNVHE